MSILRLYEYASREMATETTISHNSYKDDEEEEEEQRKIRYFF